MRLAPHCGHNPRHPSWHNGRVGSASSNCSRIRGETSTSSPSYSRKLEILGVEILAVQSCRPTWAPERSGNPGLLTTLKSSAQRAQVAVTSAAEETGEKQLHSRAIMRQPDRKRPPDAILANRPLLQQPVDFGIGLDQVEFLDFSRYVVNSQLHSDTTPTPAKGVQSNPNYCTSWSGFKYGRCGFERWHSLPPSQTFPDSPKPK